MSTIFTKAFFAAVFTGLLISSSARAGESCLDASSKMRGVYGSTSQSTAVWSRPVNHLSGAEPSRDIATAMSDTSASRKSGSAKESTRSTRSYSYELTYRFSDSPVGHASGSQTPLYLLPKSDPRRQTGR